MSELLLKDEVYAVIGAAMRVHSELGHGFLEAVYHEALGMELEEGAVPFAAEQSIPIYYRGRRLKKDYVADFICFGQIIVEIKALDQLTTKEEAQLLNYLKATGLRVGILINFGSQGRLEWKRMIR